MLYPPPPSQGGVEDGAEAAQRLHRALNARPARRGCREAGARGGAAAKGKKEEQEEAEVKEEEEVKISALEMAVKDEPEEDIKIHELEYGGEGGQRRGVKREREEDIVVEAGPSGRGAGGRQQAGLELYLDRSSAGSSSRCSGWTRGGVGGGYREGQSKIRVLLPCSRPKRRWHRPLLPPKEGERPRRTVGAGGGKERNKLSPVRESVGCSTSQWDPPKSAPCNCGWFSSLPQSTHPPAA